MGVIYSGCSMGAICGAIIISALFNTYGLATFPFIVLGANCLMGLIYSIAWIAAVRHGEKGRHLVSCNERETLLHK